MEPVVIAIIAASVGLGVGFLAGRANGVRLGVEAGRREGAERGRTSALEEGRTRGIAEGRALGRSEGEESGRTAGHRAGYEEGRAAGREEGYREGVEAGRVVAGDDVRSEERAEALRDAVGRVSSFLATQVRAPLAGATPESESADLYERIARAVGALEDVDFFLRDIDTTPEGADLAKLVGQVAREFATDQDVGVRVMLGSPVVRARVNGDALLDALYLILHNAARFGGGETIDVSAAIEDGRARIVVRDRGEGFSEEAFSRAFDPFYSTTPDGLGLGLPHARTVIERLGGTIQLRNVPDGGAEVEVSFPTG